MLHIAYKNNCRAPAKPSPTASTQQRLQLLFEHAWCAERPCRRAPVALRGGACVQLLDFKFAGALLDALERVARQDGPLSRRLGRLQRAARQQLAAQRAAGAMKGTHLIECFVGGASRMTSPVCGHAPWPACGCASSCDCDTPTFSHKMDLTRCMLHSQLHSRMRFNAPPRPPAAQALVEHVSVVHGAHGGGLVPCVHHQRRLPAGGKRAQHRVLGLRGR